MSCDRATVDAIVAAASGAGDVSARAMFGEYALYCDGKVVALICNDILFVKPTAPGRTLAPGAVDAPPYRGAKPSMQIARDDWEDGQWLSALVRATADALPVPKPRKRKG